MYIIILTDSLPLATAIKLTLAAKKGEFIKLKLIRKNSIFAFADYFLFQAI